MCFFRDLTARIAKDTAQLNLFSFLRSNVFMYKLQILTHTHTNPTQLVNRNLHKLARKVTCKLSKPCKQYLFGKKNLADLTISDHVISNFALQEYGFSQAI